MSIQKFVAAAVFLSLAVNCHSQTVSPAGAAPGQLKGIFRNPGLDGIVVSSQSLEQAAAPGLAVVKPIVNGQPAQPAQSVINHQSLTIFPSNSGTAPASQQGRGSSIRSESMQITPPPVFLGELLTLQLQALKPGELPSQQQQSSLHQILSVAAAGPNLDPALLLRLEQSLVLGISHRQAATPIPVSVANALCGILSRQTKPEEFATTVNGLRTALSNLGVTPLLADAIASDLILAIADFYRDQVSH